jgi:Ca-activated chloride channel homolog
MSRTAFIHRIAALMLVSGVLLPAAARAQDETLSPYFFVQGGDPGVDRLPLLGTDVTVNVSGVIADVTVRQTYKNAGSRPIHAKYVFPASTRAAVHGLTMTIGHEIVHAQIREREQAKREFDAAKKAGKNAALLEQQRPNVFTMNVANVVPGQTIEVELRYSELLVPVDGVYEFTYPTVVGPRYSEITKATASDADGWLHTAYTHAAEPPAATFALAGTLNAGVPIESIESPSHAMRAERANASTARFSLDPAEAHGGNRDFVLRYRLEGARIQTGLMLYAGQNEQFFLMMLQPPRQVATAEIPPREYVFVIDVSGSMRGFPLDVSKELLRDLIGHLRPTDTFNMEFFSGGSRLWAPRSQPATPENITRAIAALSEEQGGGGTLLLAAVQRAMALPHEDGVSRNVIVVTDGYIAAEKEVFSFIREHLNEANVFSFGIGSSVNRYLIEGIARAGLGEPFVSLDAAEARTNAKRFRAYVDTPVLTNVVVAFDGFDAYDVEPTELPDVLADRPILVQGKYRGAPRGRVTVSGVTGAGAYRQVLDVAGVRPDDSNSALRQLWARTRIADLSDFRVGAESDQEKAQLVELGLTYNLLTRYTSFIAVHETIRNDMGPGEDVDQPLPMPAGVTDTAVGGMAAGDEPGLAMLVAIMLAGGAVVAFRQRRVAVRR